MLMGGCPVKTFLSNTVMNNRDGKASFVSGKLKTSLVSQRNFCIYYVSIINSGRQSNVFFNIVIQFLGFFFFLQKIGTF